MDLYAFLVIFLCCSLFVRFSHVVACSLVHFHCCVAFYYMITIILFVHSTDQRHLGCFQFGAFLNITVMSFLVYDSDHKCRVFL